MAKTIIHTPNAANAVNHLPTRMFYRRIKSKEYTDMIMAPMAGQARNNAQSFRPNFQDIRSKNRQHGHSASKQTRQTYQARTRPTVKPDS